VSKKYNHMLDMAFEIETDEKVWYNIPKPAIIAAVLKRVADIVREDTDLGETFSHLQTCEVEGQVTYSEQMQDDLEPIGGMSADWTFHTTDDDCEFENE